MVKNTVNAARYLPITIWEILTGDVNSKTSVPDFLSSAKVLIVNMGISITRKKLAK